MHSGILLNNTKEVYMYARHVSALFLHETLFKTMRNINQSSVFTGTVDTGTLELSQWTHSIYGKHIK